MGIENYLDAHPLKVGDEVTITLKHGDNTIPKDMRKYDGLITTISRAGRIKNANTNQSMARYYECDGVVSSFGVPYSFTREMLVTDEEVWLEN